MRSRTLAALLAVLLTLFLAGCAEEQPQDDVSDGSATQSASETESAMTTSGTGGTTMETTGGTTVGETTVGETTGGATMGGTTVDGTTSGTTSSGATQALGDATSAETTRQLSGEEVTVGGFSVSDPGFPEFDVPGATVPQEAVSEYLDKVQPVVEGSTRDVSDLFRSEASVQDGDLTLNVGTETLENARDDVRSGLDQLRGVGAPESLEPIDEQLLSSFNRGLAAYNNMINAIESGESQRVNDAVQNSLPRIERFNTEAGAIVQNLEAATETAEDQ